MTAIASTSVVQAHFAASIAASDRFFAADAPRIAECCRRMAERFAKGGTLFVMGEGAQWSDAQHVSVEFVHPIVVGKRALPAIAFRSADTAFGSIAGRDDILLTLAAGAVAPVMSAAIESARQRGLLTIGIAGRPVDVADLAFTIDHDHSLIVQEVSETLYHVLWELVHVFLDARDAEVSSWLPGSGTSVDEATLVEQVVVSTRQKASEVTALRRAVVEKSGHEILEASDAMATRVRRGGRFLAFGNGGSATDAQDVVADARAPALPAWQSIPALALTDDIGVITAVANDVGFEHVFARQIAAFGRPDDVALAFSTSGASRNLLAAMALARQRGLLTVAMSGGDGGAIARSSDVDFCFTAPSEHLPRIQEAHATTWHALLAAVQDRLR